MLDKQVELESLTEQDELGRGNVKTQRNNSEQQQTAQTDTKKVSLKGKQTKVTREKPMVVTDDDLRDISSYRKYKIKAKPVSLHRLYLSNEKARRANKREDKLYDNQKEELRRKFNIELVKLEFEYQIENASKLAFEEERILAEKAAKLKRQGVIDQEEKAKSELKLPPIRTDFHGYVSEPGSKRTGSKSLPKGSNDVLSKHKAIAENYAREERINSYRREKKCRKLLKKEKLVAAKHYKRAEKFDNTTWLSEVLSDGEDETEFFNEKDGVDFTGIISDSDEEEVISPRTLKQRKLNGIRDNFLRLYLKYDTENGTGNGIEIGNGNDEFKNDGQLDEYLKRHDSPTKRNAELTENGEWVAGGKVEESRVGSRLSRNGSVASRLGGGVDLDEEIEKMKNVRMSLPDINQAMDTSRRTRYLRFRQPSIFETELSCDQILEGTQETILE